MAKGPTTFTTWPMIFLIGFATTLNAKSFSMVIVVSCSSFCQLPKPMSVWVFMCPKKILELNFGSS